MTEHYAGYHHVPPEDEPQPGERAGKGKGRGDGAGAPLIVPTFTTETELAGKLLLPPTFIVHGILPVGSALLSAPPKVGKTWFNFALARSVATGALFCSNRTVAQGPVLFLDLEGNDRRAKARSATVRGDGAPSDNFKMIHEWPRMDQGGLELLQAAILKEKAKLSIVDIWSCFRAYRPKSADPYQWDHDQAKLVSQVAADTQSVILLTHHNRKTPDADWVNDATGSSGTAGGVDTLLSLGRGRGSADAVLRVTGRDIMDEVELAMSFKDGRWTILGDALEVLMGRTRQTIHSLLCFRKAPMSPKEIAEETELPRNAVKKALARMLSDGTVSVTNGRYQPRESVPCG